EKDTPEEPQIVFRHDAEIGLQLDYEIWQAIKARTPLVPPRSTHCKQPASHPTPSPPPSASL
ncbi:443_t:CDS:2, partial [Paraglomus brasilianum]